MRQTALSLSAGMLALAMCLSPISLDYRSLQITTGAAFAHGLNNFGGSGGRFGVGPGDGSAGAPYGQDGRFGAGGPFAFSGPGPFGGSGPFGGAAGGPPDGVGTGASTNGADNGQGAAHNTNGCTGQDCL
jgi:hypothetical protein